MFKILRTIMLFLFSGLYANVTPYGEALKTGVFDSMINIDYGDEVYRNKVLHAPLLYIIDMMRSKPAGTSTVKGFDEIVQKSQVTTVAAITSQTALATELTLTDTFTANEKHNMVEKQILQFNFVPVGTNYTNYCYVSDKMNSTDTTSIKVTPIVATEYFGIANGTPVPTSTKVNILGTYFQDYSGSVSPISTSPTTFTNYVQYFKTPFGYGDIAAKENLYIKGTIMNRLETDKRAIHLAENEQSFLFQGAAWQKNVTTSLLTEQNATMEGLIYAIKNSSSPAIKSYTTFSYDKFDDWQWNLFDPELEDQAEKRFTICNKAMKKFFTDLKKDKPGVELVANDTYGLPGIKTIETDAGTFDLLTHAKIHRWNSDKDKPYAVALTLPMIEFNPMIPTYLALNIQDNDETGRKGEYRSAWTYKLHNRDTAYHGLLYNL